MRNRGLERSKDSAVDIINELAIEIEELEAINDNLQEELDRANSEIEQLREMVLDLESS